MLREAEKGQFDRYLMNLNLNSPGKVDIEPAKMVWEKVKNMVDGKNVKFLAISFTSETVKLGRGAGIPSGLTDRLQIEDFRQFLN